MQELWFDPDKVLIGGEWRAVAAHLPLFDPSTGDQIGRIARGDAGDVDAAVTAAQTALAGDWGRATAAERGRVLMRLSGDFLVSMEEEVRKPLKKIRID